MFLNDAVSYLAGVSTTGLKWLLNNFMLIVFITVVLYFTWQFVRVLRSGRINNAGEKI